MSTKHLQRQELLKNEEIRNLMADFVALYRHSNDIIPVAALDFEFAVQCAVEDMLNEMCDHSDPVFCLRDAISYKSEKLMKFLADKMNAQQMAV